MASVQRLAIFDADASVEEQADRAVGTVTDFIALHMGFAERTVFPSSYDELREILIGTEANFGTPPSKEVFDAGGYEHTAWVPETYEELRDVTLSGVQTRIEEADLSYYDSYSLTAAIEESFPQEEEEFMIRCRRAWISWTTGAVFALEEIAPQMSNNPIEDLIRTLTGE